MTHPAAVTVDAIEKLLEEMWSGYRAQPEFIQWRPYWPLSTKEKEVAKQNRRIVAGTEGARRLHNIGRPVNLAAITPEQKAWNDEVDRKRAEKAMRRNP